jgi:antitoxin (DNA-binding transcriptional repressor) of toxin-antitoxin stability system
MSTIIDVRELPARLQEALDLVGAGNEVLVTDGAIPRAKLVPCSNGGLRKLGLHIGAIQTTADFDAPLPDDFWGGSA